MAEEKGKKDDKKEEKGKGKEGAGEEGAEGEGEGEGKKKKSLPIKIIAIVSASLILIGAIVYVAAFVAKKEVDPYSQPPAEKKDDERKKTYTTLSPFRLGSKELPDFKMVITDRGEQHNVKCIIWLGYAEHFDKDTKFKEELTKRMASLRELVYRTMGGKTLEELQYRNLDRLEDELLTRMNEVLEHGNITDIMFEEYIVQ